MNTSNIKKYAPKARAAFIDAMTKQAMIYGISRDQIAPATSKGDVVLIGDRVFAASILGARQRLVERIAQQGFDVVMEYVAYSWFNRLCAIRYMELKGFLDHGRRVLSSADGSAGMPQILEECLDIELEGLDQDRVRALKLDGTQDELLYRELLLAQCRALHKAMPMLFEALADETELLLPDNLTKTDSLIRDLVASIPEEDWQQIEVIGWLYQFYISDKKDQVIGKVVKNEDIPAATQLFTPNWIVQYLVQNSIGRQWMQTYPDSSLQQQMPYYIAPAQQSAEVQAQLDAITPKTLDPESIQILDPACGSGHILAEAYQVLKAIYLERGYRIRDIPQLILQNNVFGLDIDDRAGQLAAFTLMMLAREDDRKIFERDVRLNVLALQSSQGLDVATLWRDLGLGAAWRSESLNLFADDTPTLGDDDARLQLLRDVVGLFAQAKTFGSLIDVPAAWLADLLALQAELEGFLGQSDVIRKRAAGQVLPLLRQAVVLARRYDAVVANPPYMGGKGMNAELKAFAQKKFPDSKSDLFAMFMERGFKLLTGTGFNAQVTMQSWMFLSSYEAMREKLISRSTLDCMVHMGNGVMGIAFGTAATVFRKNYIENFTGNFSYCENEDLNEQNVPKEFPVKNARLKQAKQGEFKKIPASPIAYWVSESMKALFSSNPRLASLSEPRRGLQPGDTPRHVRIWQEVSLLNTSFSIKQEHVSGLTDRIKWVGFTSGGSFRKWAGNLSFVVNWYKSGFDIKNGQNPIVPNEHLYFKEAITWSKISSAAPSFRKHPSGLIPGDAGPFAIVQEEWCEAVFASLNAIHTLELLKILAPTLNFQVGDVGNVPILRVKATEKNVNRLVLMSEDDWDAYERSWDFTRLPILSTSHKQPSLAASYTATRAHWQHMTSEMQRLEQENNRIFIDAYGLQDELTPDVPLKEITLTCNPHYRYGGDSTPEQLEQRLQSDTAVELISYAIGCMMGRYSLDRDGLVYAHAGNQGFADLVSAGAYSSFPADDDGIIPLTAQEWFGDDTTNRFANFVQTVWPDSNLSDNLKFVADSLCLHAVKPLAKKGMAESALDTIRRYLSSQFYKDHLKTYKKRPIYWLFSSGKEQAFECLVYLHRYHEGTLARMRTEYVIPLTAKLTAHLNKLEQDKDASDSTTEIKRLEKEIAQVHKQQVELSRFDENLRSYADQRISLDLDDGVKVNYAKFGNLLANVKDVTGDKASD